MKEKLIALLDRNASLYQKTPENKRKLRAKLITTHNDLKHEHRIVTYKLAKEEEQLIRQGCPINWQSIAKTSPFL